MNSWFRFYDDVLNDPKVQQLEPDDFKFWINILCLASKNNGQLPCLASVSFAFRMPLGEVEVRMKFMASSGLVDSKRGIVTPHNWNKRQYKSDSSTARVKQFRKRFGNVSETAIETPPEQIQSRAETEQIQSRKEPLAISSPVVPKYPEGFELFWGNSTKRGSKLQAVAEWKKLEPDDELVIEILRGMHSWRDSEQWQTEKLQPHICRWLKRRGWEEIVPKRAIAENLRAGLIERQSLEHTTHFCGNCEVQHDWPCGELCTTGPGPRSCPEFVGRFMH